MDFVYKNDKELTQKNISDIKNHLYLTDVKQLNTKNGRFYEIDIGINKLKLHSVTSVLSKTSSKEKTEGLKAWRERLGDTESDLICKTSLNRGTVMHDCLDFYFESKNLIESMEKSKIKNKKIEEKYIKNGQRLFIQLYKSGLLNNVKVSNYKNLIKRDSVNNTIQFLPNKKGCYSIYGELIVSGLSGYAHFPFKHEFLIKK